MTMHVILVNIYLFGVGLFGLIVWVVGGGILCIAVGDLIKLAADMWTEIKDRRAKS